MLLLVLLLVLLLLVLLLLLDVDRLSSIFQGLAKPYSGVMSARAFTSSIICSQ